MISIFAKPYFIGQDDEELGGPYICVYRGTSLIRGEQMARELGGKYNPTTVDENDVCIYLKPRSLNNIKDGSYVDVSDTGDELVEMLKARPKIKAITSSIPTYEYVKSKL